MSRHRAVLKGFFIIRGLVALCLLLLLAGCTERLTHVFPGSGTTGNDIGAGSAVDPSTPGAPPAWQLAGVPALPADKPLNAEELKARRSSVLGETSLLGSQALNFEQNSVSIDPRSQTLKLHPGGAQLAWAMYAFTSLLP